MDVTSWDTVPDATRETRNHDNRMAEADAYDAWMALPEEEREWLEAAGESDPTTWDVAR